MNSSALISECGRYRYSLTRRVNTRDTGRVVFVGVNPSTADAHVDDATIRKMKAFAFRWGYDLMTVVNLFAYRATDVRELSAQADPTGGRHADAVIREVLKGAQLVIPCWGAYAKMPQKHLPRVSHVLTLLQEAGVPMRCFGVNRDGSPKHPLMLGYKTELVPFP